jgi:hypothetical protein
MGRTNADLKGKGYAMGEIATLNRDCRDSCGERTIHRRQSI